MENKPLVSIVMPAFNGEKYIGECIESIINQTYQEWELIIVEDCSTDCTYEKILEYSDSRISIMRNAKNMGIAYTTNRAIAQCRGKYIALIDDDDIALPERLRIQVEFLEKNEEIDVLGGRSIEIDENGQLLAYGDYPLNNSKFIKATLLFRMVNFTNATLMFRKEFIEKNHIFLREGCYGIQDLRFFMDCSKKGNMTAIEDLLIKHRMYATSTTKRMLSDKARERATAYAQAQKDSIRSSGFELDDKDMDFLTDVFSEIAGRACTFDELQRVYLLLTKIVKQGKIMKIDYQHELEAACFNQLTLVMKRSNIFSDANTD